jgi:two-component system, NtrC family, sensor kinase
MKCIFTLIVFALFTGVAIAQSNDSLPQFTQSLHEEDTSNVNELISVSESFASVKPDTALFLAYQALLLAKRLNFAQGEADALFTIGKIFKNIGNYPKALEFYFESLKIDNRLNNEIWIASNYLFIGEVFEYTNNYSQSLSYYYRANDIAKSFKYYNILARALLYIGNTYEKLNKLDSSLFYTQKSFLLASKDSVPYLLGKIFNTFGNIYSKLGETNLAMKYYGESIPILVKDSEDNYVCFSSLGMAKLFSIKNEADSSLFYARQSLQIARKANFALQMLEASSFLTEFYKNINDYDSAFTYQQISIEAKDSVFSQEKTNEFASILLSEQFHQQEIKEAAAHFRYQVKMYILLGGLCCVLFLAFILYRNNLQKQRANKLLSLQKKEIELQSIKLEDAFKELKTTQAQLIQSEKMASLGEITAGIAHEIQNPLNFVNNFSEMNVELADELKKEHESGNTVEAIAVAEDIKENNLKITHHGKRVDAIVKSMLLHSRISTGKREPIEINALIDENLKLSYNGLYVKDKSFNANLRTDFDLSIPKINLVPQDIARVLINLFNNAYYEVSEKKKQLGEGYDPTISISTRKLDSKVEIRIKDNGDGIPQNNLDKIFQPFFTTKPTGKGAGLGLSLSYDILKAHGGQIKVETKEGEFTEFVIQLPL